MRTRVKICGITNEEDGRLAVDAGADALGFVFWSGSPRRVERSTAQEIAAAIPPSVWRVGVFVDAPLDELAACLREVPLDVLQLHGSETVTGARDLGARVWKVVRVGPGFAHGDLDGLREQVDGVLLDTKSDLPGGTGTVFDWGLVRDVRQSIPFLVLAGGLRPENVVAAIREVHPDVVDVSTGVESRPGRKDPAKVKAFLDAVRSAG
jgi:phosphoribosylanthranilate isomerase